MAFNDLNSNRHTFPSFNDITPQMAPSVTNFYIFILSHNMKQLHQSLTFQKSGQKCLKKFYIVRFKKKCIFDMLSIVSTATSAGLF